MASTAQRPRLAVDDYLQGELCSDIRHEYVDGGIYARADASAAHNIIALNLAALLRAHLRGGPCQVFIADMKVRLRYRGERFYYPDVQVCCDPQDRETYYRTRPKLIVEVLSPHTEREDRSSKFYAYRRINSLEEYVLVAQEVRRVEVYRRATGWDLELYGGDDAIRLESVAFTVAVAEVYESVDIPPP
ncbi:MAG: Uma2 family endonuclease [Pseudomonadota bacterium]|nr:Uma2 family endonuclease [Pseudomonadota bacterium]